MGCIANESNFNSCKSKEEIVSSIKDMIKLLNSNMRDYISMKHEGKIQALQKIMSDSEEIIVLLKNSEKDFELETLKDLLSDYYDFNQKNGIKGNYVKIRDEIMSLINS